MPILDPHSLEFLSRGTEYTRRVGIRLGTLLRSGDLICLVGDLGSGKTTLVQGLAAGWGSLDQVTSPTFVLVNLYRRPDGGRLYHLDAYRLTDGREAADLDLNEMLDGGILVVEWSERIEKALPKGQLRITLNWIDIVQRDLIFTPRGSRYQSLLAELRTRIYGGL